MHCWSVLTFRWDLLHASSESVTFIQVDARPSTTVPGHNSLTLTYKMTHFLPPYHSIILLKKIRSPWRQRQHIPSKH